MKYLLNLGFSFEIIKPTMSYENELRYVRFSCSTQDRWRRLCWTLLSILPPPVYQQNNDKLFMQNTQLICTPISYLANVNDRIDVVSVHVEDRSSHNHRHIGTVRWRPGQNKMLTASCLDHVFLTFVFAQTWNFWGRWWTRSGCWRRREWSRGWCKPANRSSGTFRTPPPARWRRRRRAAVWTWSSRRWRRRGRTARPWSFPAPPGPLLRGGRGWRRGRGWSSCWSGGWCAGATFPDDTSRRRCPRRLFVLFIIYLCLFYFQFKWQVVLMIEDLRKIRLHLLFFDLVPFFKLFLKLSIYLGYFYLL